MNIIMRSATIAAALVMFGNQTVLAQEDDRAGGPPRWSIGGLGLAYMSPFEAENTKSLGGEKLRSTAVPYITYRGDDFYFQGLEMGYHLLKPERGKDLSLGVDLIAGGRMQPGKSRNKFTADAGLRVSLEGAFGTLSLTGLQDVTSEHNGQEFKASYGYRFSGQKWSLAPSVGVLWQSKGLAEYMWGVTAEQQAKMIEKNDPVLPIFSVGSSVLNYEANLFASYRVTDNWTAIAFGGMTFLDKKIKENPGINKDFEASIGLGIAYSF